MISENIKKAIILSLIVGSLLNIINSYDVILHCTFTAGNTIKIILTYFPPFCVSLYSSNSASKAKKNTVTE
jgi:hypothetical protein